MVCEKSTFTFVEVFVMRNANFVEITRPDSRLVSEFKDIPVARIADHMGRKACLNARIKPINESALLGTAITVTTRPGDHSSIRQAIETAAPGDVIVIDTQRDSSSAAIDDALVARAEERGIAGIVVDGAVRGISAIRKRRIPVYAAGVTPFRSPEPAAGTINAAITCGGAMVVPGDLVIGDADGVIIIPCADLRTVLTKARIRASEAVVMPRPALDAGRRHRPRVQIPVACPAPA
jgi:regulator of RNase E activity RraA